MSGTYGSYGSLMVCGNYEGNLEGIAEVLNGFVFDQDDDQDQRFVVHDGHIKTNHFMADNTTAAFPLCEWFKSGDGRRLPANKYRELLNEDDDWDFDNYEEVSLAELSRTIAPLLKRGTLQLVSIRHYMSQFIDFETLAIHSDGRVQRQRQRCESLPRDKWYTRSTATFKPPKLLT
jgi:hypothetical protein